MRSGGPPTALDPTATPGRPLRHRGARSRSAHTVAQALLLPDFEKQPPPPGKEATFTVRFHFGRYCETVAPSGTTRPLAGVGGATVRVDAAQRAACAPPLRESPRWSSFSRLCARSASACSASETSAPA